MQKPERENFIIFGSWGVLGKKIILVNFICLKISQIELHYSISNYCIKMKRDIQNLKKYCKGNFVFVFYYVVFLVGSEMWYETFCGIANTYWITL